jgi:hypothetical protein
MVVVHPVRILSATFAAAVVCAFGVWLYMGNIHGQSAVVRTVLRWAFPTVSLASLFDFFGSNLVYWVSLLLSYALWVLLVYLVLSWFDRRRGS